MTIFRAVQEESLRVLPQYKKNPKSLIKLELWS
jgi:hypothetical protein